MFALLASAVALQYPSHSEVQPDWVTKSHVAKLAGQVVKYQTTCGLMPIRAKTGVVDGKIFFTYYARTDEPIGTKRPLLFVFNGGPGSASVWMHLGFVGPKRPKMGTTEGFMPPTPYELVTNDESVLPETDICTIDPVGTGYSRPTTPADGTKFWSVDGDIDSVGEFIRSFLTTENRWLSPIFVMGESYGGIRGAGLSSWLHDHGVGLSGLILVSPLIGPATAEGAKPGDNQPAFYLPTFSTSAWYHHRLSPEMQAKPVSQVYDEALAFARTEYLPTLALGDKMPPEKHKAILSRLHDMTGIPEATLDQMNLRINAFRFFKELLRPLHDLVGRYDARYVGVDLAPTTNRGGADPSYTEVDAAFTSTVNDYLPNELGYKTNLRYYILGEGITSGWQFPNGRQLDESGSLRQALADNPYSKVMVCMGYYDLACPMGTNDQLLDNLNLDDRLKGNVVRKRYQSGHMIYMDQTCRRKLHADVATFIKGQTNPTAPAGIFKHG